MKVVFTFLGLLLLPCKSIGQVQLSELLDSIYFRDGVNRVDHFLEVKNRKVTYVKNSALQSILATDSSSEKLNLVVFQDDYDLYKSLKRPFFPYFTKKMVERNMVRCDEFKVNLIIYSISNNAVILQVDIGTVSRSSYENGSWHMLVEKSRLVKCDVTDEGVLKYNSIIK